MPTDGLSITHVCQELPVSDQTFRRWRNECAGTKAQEINCLKELATENRLLKKILADLGLEKAILKGVLEGNY